MINQNDPKYKDLSIYYDKVAKINYTFGGYGCFIACVCDVAGIEPQEALKKLEFDGAMLVWDSIVNIGLEPIYKDVWDNDKALAYIKENGQCIARVDWDGNPLTAKDTHFVELIGDRKLKDPIDGKTKSTTAYKIYTGIRACRKMNMAASDEILVKKTDFEGLRTKSDKWDGTCTSLELNKDTTSAEQVINVIGGYKSEATKAKAALAEYQGQNINLPEQVIKLKDRVTELTDEVKRWTDKANENWEKYDKEGKAKGQIIIEKQQVENDLAALKQDTANTTVTMTLPLFIQMLINKKVVIKKG